MCCAGTSLCHRQVGRMGLALPPSCIRIYGCSPRHIVGKELTSWSTMCGRRVGTSEHALRSCPAKESWRSLRFAQHGQIQLRRMTRSKNVWTNCPTSCPLDDNREQGSPGPRPRTATMGGRGRQPRYGPLAVENFFTPAPKRHPARRRHVVVGDVSRPPVGGRDGDIESCVCVHEPLRPGVVEVRQRALPERLRGLLVARNGTSRISRSRLVHPLNPFGRVEPSVAQFDEPAGGLRDRGRARIPLVVGRGHFGRQAGRERERLEGRARRVARVVTLPEPRAETKRPDLVEPERSRGSPGRCGSRPVGAACGRAGPCPRAAQPRRQLPRRSWGGAGL